MAAAAPVQRYAGNPAHSIAGLDPWTTDLFRRALDELTGGDGSATTLREIAERLDLKVQGVGDRHIMVICDDPRWPFEITASTQGRECWTQVDFRQGVPEALASFFQD